MAAEPIPRYATVWAIRIFLLLIYLPVMYMSIYGGPPDFDGEGAEGARAAVWILLAVLLSAWLIPTRRARRRSISRATR
jgi:hypothetical protein